MTYLSHRVVSVKKGSLPRMYKGPFFRVSIFSYGALMSGALLTGAIMSGELLSGAVMSGALLSGAVMSGALLSGLF